MNSPAPRDVTQPLQPGEDFDVYKVVESTPDLIRLRANAGCAILGAAGGAVAAVILFALWRMWTRNTPVTVYSHDDKLLTGSIIAAILAIGSAINLGRAMVIDRIGRRVRVTWFFFRTTEHSTDGLKAVLVLIEPPKQPTVVASNQGSVQKVEVSNQAIVSLVGQDGVGQPVTIRIGSSNLHPSSSWPTLAAGALQISHILKLPLRIEGAVDQTSETVRAQINQLLTP